APYDGYTDEEKTRQTILRGVFRKGDAYFNTGDLMRNIGFRHAQFVDRLGDTFRWKGENVSTTEVEQILDSADGITESVVYGVRIPGTDGRAGMACVRLDGEADRFDWQALSEYLKKELPAYAVPVFIRINTRAMQTTGTFKYLKTDLKKQGYDLNQQDNPVYCWVAGESGYQRLEPTLQKSIDNEEQRFLHSTRKPREEFHSCPMANCTNKLLVATAIHTPSPSAMGRMPVEAMRRRSDERPMATRATIIRNSAIKCSPACQFTG